MMGWIAQNIGTIVITLLLLIIVAGIIRSVVKDKKQGKSLCGGNCAHCNMCAHCRGRVSASKENHGY